MKKKFKSSLLCSFLGILAFMSTTAVHAGQVNLNNVSIPAYKAIYTSGAIDHGSGDTLALYTSYTQYATEFRFVGYDDITNRYSQWHDNTVGVTYNVTQPSNLMACQYVAAQIRTKVSKNSSSSYSGIWFY